MKRFFCSSLPNVNIKPSIVGNMIKQFSPAFMVEFKTIFFQEISKIISIDKKTVTSPTRYLMQCQEACALSDSLSSTYDVVDTNEKKALSTLYAKYADALNTFNSKSEDLIKDSIEKSLVLDPENQLARDLKTTLNYAKIPESFFVKE